MIDQKLQPLFRKVLKERGLTSEEWFEEHLAFDLYNKVGYSTECCECGSPFVLYLDPRKHPDLYKNSSRDREYHQCCLCDEITGTK